MNLVIYYYIMKKDGFLWKVMNEFEIYLGAYLFIAMTILLTVQVITRYVFNYALVWTEELSVILFVWMVYLGVAGAVTSRKHLRIDALLDIMPFKVKKVVLLIGNLISMVFSGLLIPPMLNLINNLVSSNAHTALLDIPKSLAYAIIPFAMVLCIIRYIQESVRLIKENESELGLSKPSMDLDALEAEGRKNKEHREKETVKGV